MDVITINELTSAIRWKDLIPAKVCRIPDEFNHVAAMFSFGFAHSVFDMRNCGTVGMSNVYGTYSCQHTFFYDIERKRKIEAPTRFPAALLNPFGGLSDIGYKYITEACVKLCQTKEFNQKVMNKLLEIVKGGHYQSIVFTDCVNRGTKGKGGGQYNTYTTAYTMEILEKSGLGYLVKSPVSLNPSHYATGDFSLLRHYIWYPPGAGVFRAEKYLGKGKIANSAKEFAEVIQDCNLHKHRISLQANQEQRDKLLEKAKEAVLNWNNREKPVDKE